MRKAIVVAAVLALVGVGCNGGGASDQAAASAVESTETTESDSTTTIMEPTSTTSTTTTIVEPGESTLYIDFYWVRTYGITVREAVITDGELTVTNPYGEITAIDGFVVPPVLRITAEDIEAMTLWGNGGGLDLDLSDEMCEAHRNLIFENADLFVIRFTVDEEKAWGWHLTDFSPWVPRIAHIRSSYGCAVEPPELVLYSRSTTIGDVPLAAAIEEAWLRAQE